MWGDIKKWQAIYIWPDMIRLGALTTRRSTMSQHLATLGRKNSLLRIRNWQSQTQGGAGIFFDWLVSEGEGKEERKRGKESFGSLEQNNKFKHNFFLTWGEKNLAESNQKADSLYSMVTHKSLDLKHYFPLRCPKTLTKQTKNASAGS